MMPEPEELLDPMPLADAIKAFQSTVPWIEMSQGRLTLTRVDIHCTVCDGLESFSIGLLTHDTQNIVPADFLKVKMIRFHLYCGKKVNEANSKRAPTEAKTVGLKPKRGIRL